MAGRPAQHGDAVSRARTHPRDDAHRRSDRGSPAARLQRPRQRARAATVISTAYPPRQARPSLYCAYEARRFVVVDEGTIIEDGALYEDRTLVGLDLRGR